MEGADVVHVPLIAIGEAPDAGRSLAAALVDLDRYQWLVVTSRHGADRVGGAAAQHPAVRLAAVGTTTAERLAAMAGRPPAVIPLVQTAAALCTAMPVAASTDRVLVVQADRADNALATGLRAKGYDVTTVTGYSTRLRQPTADERRAALGADAVAFASGSAATAWVAAFGTASPPVVVVIGPTTRSVAEHAGLKVTHMASDHSIEGLAAEIGSVLRLQP